MTKFPSNNILSQEHIAGLSEQAMDRFEELIDALGVELRKEKRMYVGACPVHGGDRDNAFNIFDEGETVVGNWKCRSHQCQEVFKPTLLGFIRGVLSHQQGWEEQGDDTVPFPIALKFLAAFLKADLSSFEFEIDKSASERKRDAHHVTEYFNRKKRKAPSQFKRSEIRKNLEIPSPYYLDRGYSKKILDKYDVGFCATPGKPMSHRTVVPIYDDDNKFMVGCTGRSIYEKCDECKSYHDPASGCPPESYRWQYSKWKHSKGFQAEEWLYNLWYAKNHIFQTKTAVLVESPGNVWRLEEASVHTSLGLFGTSLTEGQLDLLNKCGAMNIILCMDNDTAGEQALQPIIDSLDKLYNITILDFKGEDIGAMPASIVKRDIAPEIYGVYLNA